MNNIYLIGMMGSGKTVTGIKLAERFNRPFLDLDELIQKKEGCSISEIFSRQGEKYFRQVEADQLKQAALKTEHIIATGGGIVLFPDNIEAMQSSGEVVYLETSLEVLWSRVKGRKGRPLLEGENPRQQLERIFLTREPLYREAAQFEVPTDGRTASEVAEEIQERLEGYEKN